MDMDKRTKLKEMIDLQEKFAGLWEAGLIGVDSESIHLEMEVFLNFFDDFERQKAYNEDCRDRLVANYKGHKFFCILGSDSYHEYE